MIWPSSIPTSRPGGSERDLRVARAVWISAAGAGASLLWGALRLGQGAVHWGVDVGFGLAYLGVFGLLVGTRRLALPATLLCGLGTVQLGTALALSGGPPAMVLIVPVVATLTVGPRLGWTWLAVQALVLAATGWLSSEGTLQSPSASGWAELGVVIVLGGLVQLALSTADAHGESVVRRLDLTLGDLTSRIEARTIELEVEVEQRRLAELRAEQANHAKTAFLMNMSHELRTPLNAVLGYTELIGEELADVDAEVPDLQYELEQISAASHHLLSLIDNILEYARIEEGQLRFEPETMPAMPLLQDLADLLRPVLSTRGNRITLVEPTAGAVPEVWGDRRWIRQIVINLVSNANKFTKDGTITIAVSSEGEGTAVTVIDQGPGIDPDLLPRLFERFTRGGGDRSSGTGLGLAISRDLAQRMGGTLTVRSTGREGTTFGLWLPRRPAER